MLSMKERGILGAKAKFQKHQIKHNNEIKYNTNPTKCQECNRSLSYEKRKYRFCSRQCSTSNINRNKKIIKKCEFCSKEILGKGKFYCSTKCNFDSIKELRLKNLSEGKINCPTSVRRAFKEISPYECSNCKLKEWDNKPITLQVDHIDGNYLNNCMENLRYLCPNCHSQTENFGIKNKGNGRHKRRERYALGKSN